jgi:hypothetical protein
MCWSQQGSTVMLPCVGMTRDRRAVLFRGHAMWFGHIRRTLQIDR